jgi:hypothetical protein|tara:strand:- start:1352 stop:1669 length:318 start_codon:yes stop_codon:yes gene_type:complete
MSVKLAVLKSGEQVIAEAKELVSKDEEKVRGYLFTRPHKVVTAQPMLLTEEETQNDSSLEVTLSPWIILSADKEVVVPTDWVVTIVEPLESVVKMYQEKTDGQSN